MNLESSSAKKPTTLAEIAVAKKATLANENAAQAEIARQGDLSAAQALEAEATTKAQQEEREKQDAEEKAEAPVKADIARLTAQRDDLKMIRESLQMKSTNEDKSDDTSKPLSGVGMMEHSANVRTARKGSEQALNSFLGDKENKAFLAEEGVATIDDLTKNKTFREAEDVTKFTEAVVAEQGNNESLEVLRARLASLGVELPSGDLSDVEGAVTKKVNQLDKEISTKKLETKEGRQEVLDKFEQGIERSLSLRIKRESNFLVGKEIGGSYEEVFSEMKKEVISFMSKTPSIKPDEMKVIVERIVKKFSQDVVAQRKEVRDQYNAQTEKENRYTWREGETTSVGGGRQTEIGVDSLDSHSVNVRDVDRKFVSAIDAAVVTMSQGKRESDLSNMVPREILDTRYFSTMKSSEIERVFDGLQTDLEAVEREIASKQQEKKKKIQELSQIPNTVAQSYQRQLLMSNGLIEDVKLNTLIVSADFQRKTTFRIDGVLELIEKKNKEEQAEYENRLKEVTERLSAVRERIQALGQEPKLFGKDKWKSNHDALLQEEKSIEAEKNSLKDQRDAQDRERRNQGQQFMVTVHEGGVILPRQAISDMEKRSPLNAEGVFNLLKSSVLQETERIERETQMKVDELNKKADVIKKALEYPDIKKALDEASEKQKKATADFRATAEKTFAKFGGYGSDAAYDVLRRVKISQEREDDL